MLDIKKFNIQEIFNDNSGKTSSTSTSGFITVVLSVICFAYSCFTKYEVGITNSVVMVGIGSALLGVNKWRESSLPVSDGAKCDPPTSEEPIQ